MTWLAGQVWPFLVLSGLAGAFLAVAMSIRTTKVVHPVEVPVEVPELLPVAAARDQHSVPDGSAVPSWPFPSYRGQPEARPWEAEELWSRPVRTPATPATRGTEEPVAQADVWDVAAGSWRDWAAAARAGSSEPAATPPPEETAHGSLPGLPGSPFPALPPGDDFPYAEPVEAERS
jgi:hypothetical protein